MEAQPVTWPQYITSLIPQAQDTPMWGAFPSFPWQAFTQAFADRFTIQNLKISAGNAEWKTGKKLLTGLGRKPLQVAIELSPIEGYVSLAFPTKDFVKLSSWAIDPEANTPGFIDTYLQQGFLHYLCLETLSLVNHMKVLPGTHPKIIEATVKEEDAYCIDIVLEKGEDSICGRLICPASFQSHFKNHFNQDWNFSLPSNLYETTFLNLSLAAGTTQLSQEDWKRLDAGDFIILDHCSYQPKSHKGTFQLQLNNAPLFQVKVKEEAIKLLDYAHYFEENTMSDEHLEPPLNTPPNSEVPDDPNPPSPPVEHTPEQPMVSAPKVPISLTVEVAKIQMSLDKLLKLRPGNVLNLGIQVGSNVNLVSNGQCVGKGQLIQLEDVIGIQINQIGK